MQNAKRNCVGLLLVCTLLGFIVLTPASAASPSWVSSVGKYATYRGGVDIDLGPDARARVLVDFNWRIVSVSSSEVNVTGGFSVDFAVNIMGLANASASAYMPSWELIDLGNSVIKLPPGGVPGGSILFDMENVGSPTNLWVEDPPSWPQSNVSIGSRKCVQSPDSAFILGFSVPVMKYYDMQTGMLMGMGVSINISAMSNPAPAAFEQAVNLAKWSGGGDVGANQFPGMGDSGVFTFPVVLNGTNVIPFAWNVGGDPIFLIEALSVLAGLSVVFGVALYAKRK